MRYRIDAIIPHGLAVKEFRLAPIGHAPIPAWQPGAHVEVALRARDGATFANAYSIIGEMDGMSASPCFANRAATVARAFCTMSVSLAQCWKLACRWTASDCTPAPRARY